MILVKSRFYLKILATVGALDRPLTQRWRGRGVVLFFFKFQEILVDFICNFMRKSLVHYNPH